MIFKLIGRKPSDIPGLINKCNGLWTAMENSFQYPVLAAKLKYFNKTGELFEDSSYVVFFTGMQQVYFDQIKILEDYLIKKINPNFAKDKKITEKQFSDFVTKCAKPLDHNDSRLVAKILEDFYENFPNVSSKEFPLITHMKGKNVSFFNEYKPFIEELNKKMDSKL